MEYGIKTIFFSVLVLGCIFFYNADTFSDNLNNRNPRSGIKFKKLKQDKLELKRIKRLALKGDPILQNKLGWMYDQGFGIKENPEKALKWYLKSAEQGFRQAQINSGVLFETGRGTAKDLGRANYWYTRANLRVDLNGIK